MTDPEFKILPVTQTREGMVFIGKVAEWLKTAPEQDHCEDAQFHVGTVTLAYNGLDDGLGYFYNEDPDWMWESGHSECGRKRPGGTDVCNLVRGHPGKHGMIQMPWSD